MAEQDILKQLTDALNKVSDKETTTEEQPKEIVVTDFCSAEERLSTHNCNSLHPSACLDAAGNIGLVWHDTRDGNFEIYFKILPSRIDTSSLSLKEGHIFDPASGRPINLNCSGYSAATSLTKLCNISDTKEQEGTLTLSGGRLDVNSFSRTLVLTSQKVGSSTNVGGIGFSALGVTPNSLVTILNGQNSSKKFLVARILAPDVLELVYTPDAKNDEGFAFSITNQKNTKQTCEVRLTCGKSTALFPDIVADSDGRFHIVYQDDSTGNFELYYLQVYPSHIGEKKATISFPVSTMSFQDVAVNTPNAIAVTTQDTTKYFLPTGAPGSFFSYGNRSLPDPIPVTTGAISSRTGTHKIFKDFTTDSLWTGVSLAADKEVWEKQAIAAGITPSYPYVAPANHPIAGEGDFGVKLSCKSLAIIAQTPPDRPIGITRVGLPLYPRCLPQSSQVSSEIRTQDIIAAPKASIPPNFSDPIDLDKYISSYQTKIDTSVPERFTIEGDSSGDIFTNILLENSNNERSRVVFSCNSNKCETSNIKFLIGQRKCGEELCGVRTSEDPTALSSNNRPRIMLQVWEGPDYRSSTNQILSATMTAKKILEREFSFDFGESTSFFNFKPNELTVSEGKYIFFVPIAIDQTDFYLQGSGNGHSLWSTLGNGTFDQYYINWTLSPNSGLQIPVYYEGYLGGKITLPPPPPPPDVYECYTLTVSSEDFDKIKNYTHIFISSVDNKKLSSEACFSVTSADKSTNTLYVQQIYGEKIHIDKNRHSVILSKDPFAGETNTITIDGQKTVMEKLSSWAGKAKISRTDQFFQLNCVDEPISLFFALRRNFSTYTTLNILDGEEVTNAYLACQSMMARFGNAVVIHTYGVYNSPERWEGSDLPIIPKIGYYPPLTYIPPTNYPNITGLAAANFGNETFTQFFNINKSSTINSIRFLAQIMSPPDSSPNPIRLMSQDPTVIIIKIKDSAGNVIIGSHTVTKEEKINTEPKIFEVFFPYNVIVPGELEITYDVSPSFGAIKYNPEIHAVDMHTPMLLAASWPTFGPAIEEGSYYNNARHFTEYWPSIQVNLLILETRQEILEKTEFSGVEVNFSDASSLAIRGELSSGCSKTTTPNEPTTTTTSIPDTPNTPTLVPKDTEYVSSIPFKLTNSKGASTHPRLAIDEYNNMWLTFHSNRTGTDEVYVARYFGSTGQWSTTTSGGTEYNISKVGEKGRKAQFGNCVVFEGDAHFVFQSNDTEDEKNEIFYCRTTNGATSFTKPTRLTISQGQAMMPDISRIITSSMAAKAKCDGIHTTGFTNKGLGRLIVTWHDDRFGQFEIMAAEKINGTWNSSGYNSSDIRITQSLGDSVFPRIACDTKGNVRIVYHDYRRGRDNPWIMMSSYFGYADRWDCSGQGGIDLPITPLGSAASLHPDIAIDPSNGVFVCWHDTRFMSEGPDQHEEIMGTYCPKSDSPFAHFSPLCTNSEKYLETVFEIVDCVTNSPIEFTNVPQVCLKVSSLGATFYRVSGDDGDFTPWEQFRPTADIDTVTIPFTLGCGNGKKKICIQVQNANTIGFPVCKEIILSSPLPSFKIELYKDYNLTIPFPKYGKHQATSSGDVFVKLSSSTPLVLPPTFDVVSRGLRLAFNQQTEIVNKTNNFSGFSGATENKLDGNVISDQNIQGFSAYGGSVFRGRFKIIKDDGFFHIDGLAKIIPHGTDIRGQIF